MSVATLTLAEVTGWDIDDLAITRDYGDRWLAARRSCILLVPSVIVPTENNVLINPAHADVVRVIASVPRDLNWDKRLSSFLKR